MKWRGGFSFIEVIISFSVFIVLAAVSLPMISIAAKNLAYARNGYEAYLAANRLVQTARTALSNGSDLETDAESLNLNVFAYSIWIVDQSGQRAVHSRNAPEADMSLTGYPHMNISGSLHIYVVVVWGECGSVLSRTVGAVNK